MPTKSKSLVPAVSYLRCSTEKQDTSIADQRKAVRQYASKQGYRLVREYVDDGISGDATEKRVGFLQMREDAQYNADFKAILCWDQDRFGRFDSLEAGHWIYPIRQAGVSLEPINEGPVDWNDFTGRMMYGIKQEGKHQFLKDLSRNVTRGQVEAAKAGNWPSGAPPYGYRLEGERKQKRLALGDARQVRIVERIFQEYVEQGQSLNAIARRLNAEGIPPGARGRPWSAATIKVILSNVVYVGDFRYGLMASGKYNTASSTGVAENKKRRTRKEEPDWIFHRDHHEPIIDRDTFAKAQAILAKGKTGRSNRYQPEDNPFLFAGLLRCGLCGEVLYGISCGKNRSYECKNMSKGQGCKGTTVSERNLLRDISRVIHEKFFEGDGKEVAWKAERKELNGPEDLPDGFERLKRLLRPPKQRTKDIERTKTRLQKVTADLAKARRNLVLLDEANIPAAQEVIDQLDQERAKLEIEVRTNPQPTEEDLNAETMRVLRDLYWASISFALTADPMDSEKDEGPILEGDFTPTVKRFLCTLETVKVSTEIKGQNSGKRHALQKCVLKLRKLGAVASNA